MEGAKLHSYLYFDCEAVMTKRKSSRIGKGDKEAGNRNFSLSAGSSFPYDNRGFSLVELMVTMVVFVFVIAAASQIFTSLLTQFKQQSKIGESDIEGAVGLEIMRYDIAEAGYGLPWNMNGVTYNETKAESGSTPWTERDYNDGPDNNPKRGCGSTTCSDQSPTCDPGGCYNPPAPFRSGNNLGISDTDGTTYIAHSTADLLVIKSVNVALTNTSQKWTYIANSGAFPNRLKIWNPDPSNPSVPLNLNDDLANNEPIIVLDPGRKSNQNILQKNSAGTFYTTLGASDADTFTWNQGGPTYTRSGFEPDVFTNSQYVVYGIAPNGTTPRMPFNRADYYVKRPPTNMPSRCAPNTGILYKAVTKNTMNAAACPDGGGCLTPYPILDCVADMQVVYLMDTNGDGAVDWCPAGTPGCTTCNGDTTTQNTTASPTDDISCLTAAEIRQQVKEVRVYIVAQEGQRDANYDFSRGGTRPPSFSPVLIDPANPGLQTQVNMVNLKDLVGDPDYKYYRWKLYTLVVQPNSMK